MSSRLVPIKHYAGDERGARCGLPSMYILCILMSGSRDCDIFVFWCVSEASRNICSYVLICAICDVFAFKSCSPMMLFDPHQEMTRRRRASCVFIYAAAADASGTMTTDDDAADGCRRCALRL